MQHVSLKKKKKKVLPFKQELTEGVKADSHSRVLVPYNLIELLLQLNAVSLCTERERTGRVENSRDENSSITIMEPVQIEIMRGNPAVWYPNWATKFCFIYLGVLYLHCWGGLYLITVSNLLLESAPVLRLHYYSTAVPSQG